MVAALAVMAAAGVGTSAIAVTASADKAVMPAAGRRYNAQQGLFGGGMGSGCGNSRRAGYGWTNRHAQRVARKKRNRARHRAAGRG